jgi:hypothetical protein
MEVSAELSRSFIHLPVPAKGYILSYLYSSGVSGSFPFSSLTQYSYLQVEEEVTKLM